MRVIAGSRKGHRISAPKGRDTRPTSDRVRENAFNLIGPVDGAAVLDLFAGSGAMGIEALSRGAGRATFVDNDVKTTHVIAENLEKLRLTDARVVRDDAVRALATEASARRKYDLVLVDPPYDLFDDVQPALARYLPHVLADDGVVIVETNASTEPDLAPLTLLTSRKYGNVRISKFGAGPVRGQPPQ